MLILGRKWRILRYSHSRPFDAQAPAWPAISWGKGTLSHSGRSHETCKLVAAYRGITFRQYVIVALEQYSRAELEKIHEEMDRDEQDRQKAQRFADHLEKEP